MAASTIQPQYLYADESDLQALLSVDGETGRLDDDDAGLPLSPLGQTFLAKALMWGTAKVNFYCLPSYDAADLATSPLVNHWCVICCAKWLSSRRGNPPPASIEELYKEAIEDMKLIKSGQYQIPELGTRIGSFPAWSNVRVDALYALRKIRVERPISDKQPALGYAQQGDIVANYLPEPNG